MINIIIVLRAGPAQAAAPVRRLASHGARRSMIARFVTTIVGIVVFVYGVIAAISPLPLGLPLIVLGLLMIAAANPAARPLIRSMRRRWRWFDFLVRKAARHSPKQFQETIEETDPGPERNEENAEENERQDDGDQEKPKHDHQR